MAAVCDLCGKRRNVANNVSHSHIKSKTVQKPNLHRVRAVVDGTSKRLRVCSRCLRSGKFQRPTVAKSDLNG
jgi:large subunit ribosomal protein L28